jgi:hypothetical protein
MDTVAKTMFGQESAPDRISCSVPSKDRVSHHPEFVQPRFALFNRRVEDGQTAHRDPQCPNVVDSKKRVGHSQSKGSGYVVGEFPNACPEHGVQGDPTDARLAQPV